jgi:predicted RNA binding protein YcfA (HicA-like mRNA interferase family)
LPDGGRKLRNVKATQAIRAFERPGYQPVATRGSHHRLKHPEKGQVIIPVHGGNVKVGIIMDAIKKAGITIEEFEREL